MSLPTLQSWLEEKPFTLALSSGFFGFFAHAGVVKALEENGLKPIGYTGSSAGAIVAATGAAGYSAREIENLILGVRREDFWDPSVGLGFVRGRKFEKLLESNIGASFATLQAALQIATFDILKRQTKVFEAGASLARVVRASCAVPLMFHPVWIEGRFYWDGGILDKMALSGLANGARVFAHHLQSNLPFESSKVPKTKFDLQTATLHGLPQSGPMKMHLGPEILEAAYRQMKERLKQAL